MKKWISSAYVYNGEPHASAEEVADLGGDLIEKADGTRRHLYSFEQLHDTHEAAEMRAAAVMEAYAATFAAKAAALREAAASRVACQQVVSV
jgi:hypothetical protein